MSTILLHRPERRPPPQPPDGEIILESPPEIPEVQGSGLLQPLMFLPMLAGGGGMALMFSAGGFGMGASPLMYVGSGLFAVSMLGMSLGMMGRQSGERRNRLNGLRRDYFRYLSQVRRKVRRAAEQQREALTWSGPEPQDLWWLVMGPRFWERRPGDDDFGTVRLGTGVQKLALRLIPPDSKPVEDLDALTAGALRRFVRAHSTQSGLPVSVAMHSFARIYVTGEAPAVRDLVRSTIAQTAVFHAPDDVRIMVCADDQMMPHWDWVKWLPHALHPEKADGAGRIRLMSGSLQALDRLVGEELKERARFRPGQSADALPHYVVIVDGGWVSHESQLGVDSIHGVTVIDLSGSVPPVEERNTLRLHVAHGRMSLVKIDHAGKEVVTGLGDPDGLPFLHADGLARRMAPYRISDLKAGEGADVLSANLTLPDLLGIGDPGTLEPSATWLRRARRNRLRVPIGLAADGRQVELDIKESAQGGMGPHGLLIGATGSGKSELLRTLVLGLAITHSSEILNFVLVDFKGGATFLGTEHLPHVSAVITNLADELPLVDRMYEAMHGELIRRQELLRAAGNFASQRDYEAARERGADLAPLPTLFVVLDEFSELLSAKPDFIDLFVMIGRVGRSLGVHLLLASQRLEEGRLRGLDTHLSYRIGLRTFSGMESRVVLGVPDAHELPPSPGNGYLKFDTTQMTRFKAAYVSGPYRPEATAPAPGPDPALLRQISEFGPGHVPRTVPPAPAKAAPRPDPGGSESSGKSLLNVVVGRLKGKGPPARQIWLPPLGKAPTTAQLLPPLSASPEHGLTTAGWSGRGRLRVPLGIVDLPFEQRRDPLWVDLSGAAGHVGIAGGPQSGKSTAVRTLIASLALTHTPREVQFYCLDFGGGALSSLEDLPHVGGVAGRLDGDRVRRTVAEVSAIVRRREELFRERGIEGIAVYRRSEEGRADAFGDVFLVIDGWASLRQEYEAMENSIIDLAARGLGHGVHIVATASKWSEFRPGIRDALGTRIELKLGDVYESVAGRKAAQGVPAGAPGRGITTAGKHFLTALPTIDRIQDADDLGAGVRSLVETVKEAWTAPPAPRVRLLPAVFPASGLPGPLETGRKKVPIGIDEAMLAPVLLDLEADSHFIVVGDTESGKSNLLRLIAEGVAARNTTRQARMIVIDYRRALLDADIADHRIGYAASSTAAADLIKETKAALVKRLPPADITPERLRARDWWHGSDLYVIVDDYDLVATSSNPLAPIVELLPQGREIGLHLIMARAMGGIGRSMFNPLIQQVKDLASPAVILSGNRDEGAIFGNVRPQPLPPGRGTFVDRKKGARMAQIALLPG